MSSSSSRAPLVLLLVVAAGFGVRAASASHRAPGDGAAVASLDSQITRVRDAGKRSSGPRARRTTKKGSAATPEPSPSTPVGAVRSEQTPFGALPADRLAADKSRTDRPAAVKEPKRTAKAASPTIIVNVESATAAEIEALPGIGPSLARRIVEDRRVHGPFGSIEGLQRVRGVGPALAGRLLGRVTFTTAGRP